MQTFLPVTSFEDSVKILDFKRLGKQRVEAFQILQALNGNKSQWINHPATKMWRGYEAALTEYLRLCINEWKRRGGKNNMEVPQKQLIYEFPWWFGNENLHSSHRSKLLYKYAVYYSGFGWLEKPNMPYWWPIPKKTKGEYQSKQTFKLIEKDKENLERLYNEGIALYQGESCNRS